MNWSCFSERERLEALIDAGKYDALLDAISRRLKPRRRAHATSGDAGRRPRRIADSSDPQTIKRLDFDVAWKDGFLAHSGRARSSFSAVTTGLRPPFRTATAGQHRPLNLSRERMAA